MHKMIVRNQLKLCMIQHPTENMLLKKTMGQCTYLSIVHFALMEFCYAAQLPRLLTLASINEVGSSGDVAAMSKAASWHD